MGAVCVSVHDVSPETWTRCERLLAALDEFGCFPLTLLVVPNYFSRGASAPDWYRDALDERVARGDEVALHGYTHWDDNSVPQAPSLFSRRSQTAAESEFAALSAAKAAERLDKGREWCLRQGWKPQGFVAPGWQLSPGTWQVLKQGSAFDYTTTTGSFHLLHPHISVPAPTLSYSTRSRLRRTLAHWNAVLNEQLERAALVRLALHPECADHSAILIHMRRTLEQLLARRQAMTKAAFAASLRETLSAERVAQSA